jgi:hypothetical protein
VLGERADEAAQFGDLGAAHGTQLGFECADALLEGPRGGPTVTRFGRRNLARRPTARFAVARLTPASRAKLGTVSAPSVGSGRPSNSRAHAARNAASLLAPGALMLCPLSRVRSWRLRSLSRTMASRCKGDKWPAASARRPRRSKPAPARNGGRSDRRSGSYR